MSDSSKSNPALQPVVEKPAKVTVLPKGVSPSRVTHKLDAKVLLQSLKRKWFPATLLGIVLAALVGVSLWFLVPLANPQVYARLRIPDKVGGNSFEHPDPPIQRQTQIALIKDLFTMSTVVRRPDVSQLSVIREQPEPEEWLLKEVRVDFPSGTEIMQISMTGDKPQELKAIVNAIREVYLQQYVDDTRKLRVERLKRLELHDTRTKAEIEQLRNNLKKNAESGKNIDKETIVLNQKLSLELLETTKKEIIKTQSDLRQYRTELKILQEGNGQSISGSSKLIDELLEHHPLLEPLRQRHLEIQDLLDKTRQAAPTSPKVAKLQSDLEENNKQAEQKKQALRPSVVAEMKNKVLTDRESYQESIKLKIKSLEEAETILQEDAKRLVKQSTDLSTTTIQVEEERQQLQLLESIRSRLAGNIEVLRAEEDAPDRIIRFGDPTISMLDRHSNKIRFSALGGIAAFLFGLFIIAFLDSRTRRIDSPEDVLDHFGMSVVGKVPAPPKRMRLGFSGTDKNNDDAAWQTILTESVDSFRTQLLHTAKRNSLQILTVCSADSGEGKTSLACHLALSLARSGLKTLLVDADLRNPTAHELFELPLEPGLSELIREQIPNDQAIRRTSAPGLWLLPAGVCNTRVIDLLAQDTLNPIFNELRQEFDFIIVDTSPILPVADPLLIAQHTDGVIFSLMHQVSRVSSTKDALDKLHALNIQTLGAVMNGTKPYRGYNQRKYAYRTLNN